MEATIEVQRGSKCVALVGEKLIYLQGQCRTFNDYMFCCEELCSHYPLLEAEDRASNPEEEMKTLSIRVLFPSSMSTLVDAEDPLISCLESIARLRHEETELGKALATLAYGKTFLKNVQENMEQHKESIAQQEKAKFKNSALLEQDLEKTALNEPQKVVDLLADAVDANVQVIERSFEFVSFTSVWISYRRKLVNLFKQTLEENSDHSSALLTKFVKLLQDQGAKIWNVLQKKEEDDIGQANLDTRWFVRDVVEDMVLFLSIKEKWEQT